MTDGKYAATGLEAEFEPGSRGRVLRNMLGITRVEAESQALELAQEAALDLIESDHRFTAEDVRLLHRLWLGPIYAWAGEYRSVNLGKAGFQFAHAPLIPALMAELERGALSRHTPCRPCADTAMKASGLDGRSARLPWAKGARMPSTADEVRADTPSATLRAAADLRYRFDCLSIIAQLYPHDPPHQSPSAQRC